MRHRIRRKAVLDGEERVRTRVIARMTELGVSPSELAKVIGESPDFFARFEARDEMLSSGQIFAAARLLDVSVGYFYDEAGHEEPIADFTGFVGLPMVSPHFVEGPNRVN